MTEAFICDAIRTPVGRYNGGLSAVRVDDLAAHPIKALMKRNAGVDWGGGRRRDLWLRQPGGRGQSQRGAHGGPAGRPAGRGGGRHGQSPVRLGPRGGRACGTRREARRGRHDDRRRRRGHDPLALRHGQGRRPVRPLDEARGHRAGLALRQSAHEGRLRRRRHGPDRRERRRRAPDQPHRPGRLRLSQPAPLQGGPGSRLLRPRDRQGLRQEGQDRDHRREGRASARRHHDGDPGQAAGGVPRRRLGDGGQLVGHQRCRLRHDHRLRGGGQGQRPDAARAHPRPPSRPACRPGSWASARCPPPRSFWPSSA